MWAYNQTEQCELYHYGVAGMKWGVRKSVYKSMNKQQRRETRKKYYETPEGKIKKATTIGTILGGPLGGVIAGGITAKKQKNISQNILETKTSGISQKTKSKGKKAVEKYKTSKIETDEQKITRLIKEGKANPNNDYIFDQNGKLFMVNFNTKR